MEKLTKLGVSTVEKLSEYKMEILNRVLESDKLTKLIKYSTRDALFKPSLEDPYELMHTHIYPYRFVPATVDEQKTFLTLGVNGFRRHQEGFKTFDDYLSGELYFYMFTHHDLMRTDTGVRQDLMLSEIVKMFEGTKGLGMGELKMRYVNELWMHNNKFGGYSIAFTVTDFK
ncbi:TPA: hypothetical protein ACORDH_002761 [Bacillus cereus]